MTPDFLVLGSNSFSGASFTAFLLEQGYSVAAVSRSPEGHPALTPYLWRPDREGVSFHQLDLNTQLPEICELLNALKPPRVVNFAAQSMVAESWANPDHWFMTNVVSTIRLHEVLRTLPFLERYVHVSTPEVYGSTSGSVTEDAPFNPSTPYAVSRAAADMSLRTYHAAYGFPVVTTRAANVYGPGQPLYRIIPRTLFCIRTGERLKLHGGGASQRAFIHIRDVCDATLRVALHGRLGETYHISTPDQITIRALVETICARMGVTLESVADVAEERVGKDAFYTLDSRKIRGELGWSDAVSLDAGIDETLSWVDANLDDLRRLPQSYIHKP